jgi:polar amino acid transport system substrate-binding protein
MDLFVANDNITRSGKPYKVLEESLDPKSTASVSLRRCRALTKVQGNLDAMARDGTIAQISTKWFGSDISVVGKVTFLFDLKQ